MSRFQIALETQILTEFTTTLKVGGEGLGRSDKEKSDFFLHSPSFTPPPPSSVFPSIAFLFKSFPQN